MVMPRVRPVDPYPRNRAAIVRGYEGKKVILSTTDFHYVVGWLERLGEDDVITLRVRDQQVRVPRDLVATLQDAEPALAEYVK
jgi:hypothetical protein